jgi:predicted O-linked N-acetylglucosamine transferase (SPINDLY family)
MQFAWLMSSAPGFRIPSTAPLAGQILFDLNSADRLCSRNMPVSRTTELLQEALALHRRGAVAEAAARYADVLRAEPASADAAYYLAMISCQQGRFAEGAALARQALANDPWHARAQVLLGRALSALDRPVEALESFDRAVEIDPDLAAAHGNRGRALSDLGRDAEAVASYDRALALNPDAIEDWFDRGIALLAVGRDSEALSSFDRAIVGNAEFAPAHLCRAKALSALRRHADALEAVDRALQIEPGLAEAWLGRGNFLTALRRFDDASAAYDRALAINPDLADAWLGRGNVLSGQNRRDDALAAYDRALSLGPNLAAAWLGRGNLLTELKCHDDAFAAFERALALRPDFAEAWLGRGNVLTNLKRTEEALAAYDRACAAKPELAEAWLSRGNALTQLQRLDEAFTAYDKALTLGLERAEAWLGRGNVLTELKRFDEALAAYDRALAQRPDLAEAWLGRGNILTGLNRYDEASTAYDKALALKDELAAAWLGRGNVLTEFKRDGDAFAAYDKAWQLDPDARHVAGVRLLAKLFICDWTNLQPEVDRLLALIRQGRAASTPFPLLAVASSAADQLQCAKRYAADQPAVPQIWRGEVYSHDRIRLAYLSAGFDDSAMAQLLAGFFEQHDKSRFEVTAFSFGPDDTSPMRQRLKAAFEHFIDVRERSDQDIANLVRERQIDIAVDLMGFTKNNRLGVLARRPAPIQVNYLGYPGTMGANYIDYIIADSTVIPADQCPHYTEQVVWLPQTYLINDDRRIISERTPTRRECGLPDSGFVFCCSNNNYKIMPDVFEIWMRLLRATPGSVLWLIEANAAASANLRRQADERGVSSQRLIFAPKLAVADHLARHRVADLFLDTLPYNAHTTASDALWAGLPVLTCLGTTFVGRVAASVLKAIGLDELVTHTAAQYEALALRLAADPAYLAAIKAKLARNRGDCIAFDTARMTRQFEAAYTMMWRRYQNNDWTRSIEPNPTPIRIAP